MNKQIYIKESFKRVIDGESTEIMRESKLEKEGENLKTSIKAQKRTNDEPWVEIKDYIGEFEKLDNSASDELSNAIIDNYGIETE